MACQSEADFLVDRFVDNVLPDSPAEWIQAGMNVSGIGFGRLLLKAGPGVPGAYSIFADTKVALLTGTVGGGDQYGGLTSSYIGAAAGLATGLALAALAGTAAVAFWPAVTIGLVGHVVGSAAQALYQTDWQKNHPPEDGGCPFPDEAGEPPETPPGGGGWGGAGGGSGGGASGGGSFGGVSWIGPMGGGLVGEWDPLIIDLSGDGFDLTSVAVSAVQFDLDENGFRETVGWIGNGTALIIRDLDNDGIVDGAHELIGNRDKDAFSVMAELDTNEDGYLDINDAAFSQFRVWQDLNGNGVSDAGELQALADLGIERLATTGTPSGALVNGNTIAFTGMATGSGGSAFQTGAAYFATNAISSEWEPPTGFVLLEDTYRLPNLAGYGLVKDLNAAMSLDDELLDSVEALILGSRDSTPDKYRSDFEAILLRWTGADAVAPGSRGDYVDAQVLAVVEAFYGQTFLSVVSGSNNPAIDQVSPIIEAYDNIVDVMLTRFSTQVAASYFNMTGDQSGMSSHPLFALAATWYSEDLDALTGNLLPTLMLVKQFAPHEAAAQLDYYGMALSSFRGADAEYFNYQDGYSEALYLALGGSGRPFLYEFALAIHEADYVGPTVGTTGKDVLWASDQILSGGAGADTYAYVGGTITVYEDETHSVATDRLLLDTDFTPANLSVSKINDTITLHFAGEDGSVRLVNQDAVFDGGVEEIVFGDGTVWDRADLNAAYLSQAATAADDTLDGFYMSDDTLDGGGGNDTLSGRSGSDTFVFGRGSGSDVIAETHHAYHSLIGDEPGTDTVAFKAGIVLSDLKVHVVGEDLIIEIVGEDDVLTIWRGASGETDFAVEQFRFADNSVVTLAAMLALAEASNPITVETEDPTTVVLSTDDDVVEGRAWTTETFEYARGGGHDVLRAEGLSGGEESRDWIRLTDVTSTEVRFLRSGASQQDLVIEILGTPAGRIVVEGQFATTGLDASLLRGVEFSDNVILSLDDIVARMIENATTAGHDTLQGGLGDDTFEGGTGDDSVSGGNGADTYVWSSGDGHDSLKDGGSLLNGNDVLVLHGVDPADVVLFDGAAVGGQAGSVRLEFTGQDGSITLLDQGNGAIERIVFDNGDVWDASDIVLRRSGGFGATVTHAGTAGVDTLVGTSGADVFGVSAGNDRMEGSYGSDLYRFGVGAGDDTVYDSGGYAFESADGIELVGLNPEDVVLSRSYDDLLIRIASTGETLRVQWHFMSGIGAVASYNSVERLLFANGDVWNLEKINAEGDVLRGTSASETISGFYADETLIGEGGDDVLKGSGGDDTYIWKAGDGNDEIQESYEGNDTLVLHEVDPADVKLLRQGDDLQIQILTTGEIITVTRHFDTSFSLPRPYAIESIVFDDVVVWDRATIDADVILVGTDGDDYIYGPATDDRIAGGLGDDVLQGSDGSDTYEYAAGDGSDTISEYGGVDGDSDVLLLQDLLATDIQVHFDEAGDILITLPDGAVIRLDDQFSAGLEGDIGVGIEAVRFADDTVWTVADLLSASMSHGVVTGVVGGQDADVLTGGAAIDAIFGLAGDDILIGGAGDDRLIGGSGSDDLSGGAGAEVVQGGAGADTYRFGLGDGHDLVFDSGSEGDGVDQLVFGAGIDVADVTITRMDGSLTLALNGSDSVTLHEFDYANDGIEQIVFADATIWNRDDILDRYIAQGATSGDDDIEGFDRADTLTGGAGADWLAGGEGDDTYVFNLGDGADMIYDGGGVDRIVLGAGLSAAGVTFIRTYGNLTLDFGNGDQLTIADALEGEDGAFLDEFGVETIEFADTTVWTKADLAAAYLASMATTGNDRIEGYASNDTLTGGLGRDLFVDTGGADVVTDFASAEDRLSFGRWIYTTVAAALADAVQVGTDVVFGTAGLTLNNVTLLDLTAGHIELSGYDEWGEADNYVYELGYGDVAINEYATGAFDTLTFGAGIAAAGVTVSRQGDTVILTLADGHQVTLEGQFDRWTEGAGVEQILFTDATIWDREDLIDRYLAGASTSGDDYIQGFNGADVMAGGAGADSLEGGEGDDTYLFNIGDGADVIYEGGGVDRVVLGVGISSAGVGFSRSNGALTLDFGNGDTLTIENAFESDGDEFLDYYGVETIEFADTTVWTKADLASFYLASLTTAGNDRIEGLFSDDVLMGGQGSDLFVHGTGADVITDFSATEDRLSFDRSVYASAADAIADATQVGSDVVFAAAALTLVGFDLLDLTTGHIQLSGYDSSGDASAYVYQLGQGHLLIEEYNSGGFDSLTLGSGITTGSVSVTRDGDAAILTLSDGHQIRIAGQFATWAWGDGAGVEEIVFDDATTWDRDDVADAYLAQLATSGDDFIVGLYRENVLTGGGGRDTFDFGNNIGDDIVTDFNAAQDRLSFGTGQFADAFAVLSAATASGNDVVINLAEGRSVTLLNVALEDLNRANVTVGSGTDLWQEPEREETGGGAWRGGAGGGGSIEELVAFDVDEGSTPFWTRASEWISGEAGRYVEAHNVHDAWFF